MVTPEGVVSSEGDVHWTLPKTKLSVKTLHESLNQSVYVYVGVKE